MRIGIVTAMAEETLPIYEKLGHLVDEGMVKGALVRQIEYAGHTLYLAQSGVGEIRAALTAQTLIDIFEVEVVLNFGYVGAINTALNISDLVLVGNIVHHQFDISAGNNIPIGQYNERDELYFHTDATLVERVQRALSLSIPVVTVASGDKFIASKQDKDYLRNQFGADICEMEAAGLAFACERNGIPFLSLKVVSDKADDEAAISFAEVLEKGLSKYEHVLPTIIKAISCEKDTPLPPVKR